MAISEFYPFLVAFFIGLIIGIERERSHARDIPALGVRSFILIAMLGSISGYLHDPYFELLITGFVFLLIIASYYRVTQIPKSDRGITTELSGAVVYILSYFAHHNLLFSSILSGILLLILLGRTSLHYFSRTALKPIEIHAAVIILIIGVGILPFLPNRTIDPWSLFNPLKLVMLILIIATMEFSGYVAIRLFGHRFGMLLLGFFGGLVSSTAVFLAISKKYKEHKSYLASIVGCGIFATIAMLLQYLVVIGFVAPNLFKVFLIPIMVMMFLGMLMGFIVIQTKEKKQFSTSDTTNPLEIKSVLIFSLLIMIMLILISIIQRIFGIEGSGILAFLGGLVELHSVTFAAASMYVTEKFTLEEAKLTLTLALLGAFVSKFIIMGVFNRNYLGLLLSGCLLLMLMFGAISFMFL